MKITGAQMKTSRLPTARWNFQGDDRVPASAAERCRGDRMILERRERMSDNQAVDWGGGGGGGRGVWSTPSLLRGRLY